MRRERKLAKRAKLQRKKPGLVRAFAAIGAAMSGLGLRRVLGLLLIVLAAALLWLGGKQVTRFITSRPEYAIDVSRLEVPELPEWCSDEVKRSVRDKPLAEGRYCIADPRLTAFLGRKCEANPWVRKVNYVRRAFPRRIEISLELRRPLCGVESLGRYYVIDEDAVRLPLSYRNWPVASRRMPAVKGVQTPPPEEGGVWDDDAVKGAIETLRAINASKVIARAVDITVVDVSNYGGRTNPRASEVVVYTSASHEILWGRAPTRKCYGELAVNQKVHTLERLLANSACAAGVQLNIRFPGGGIIRRTPANL